MKSFARFYLVNLESTHIHLNINIIGLEDVYSFSTVKTQHKIDLLTMWLMINLTSANYLLFKSGKLEMIIFFLLTVSICDRFAWLYAYNSDLIDGILTEISKCNSVFVHYLPHAYTHCFQNIFSQTSIRLFSYYD